MGKWYAGRVRGYDARTGQHSVTYRDGDVQCLHLAHEAVLWPDVPGRDVAPPAAVAPPLPEAYKAANAVYSPAEECACSGSGREAEVLVLASSHVSLAQIIAWRPMLYVEGICSSAAQSRAVCVSISEMEASYIKVRGQ